MSVGVWMRREIEWCIWNAGIVTKSVDYSTELELNCNEMVVLGVNDGSHERVLVVDALKVNT